MTVLYRQRTEFLKINSTFYLGNIYGNITQETVNEMVLKAVQSGINFIDTSPWYGQGVSEERLGIALKNVPRDKYYIATKVSYYKPLNSVIFWTINFLTIQIHKIHNYS